MNISIVKKGTETTPNHIRFYCGHGSMLGNPFAVGRMTLAQRDRACDRFARGFPDKVQDAECRYMLRKAELLGWDIELECFCQHRGVGKRCHCETIREHMLTLLT